MKYICLALVLHLQVTSLAASSQSLFPSSEPRISGLLDCCDEKTDSCDQCEWFENRSCQQLLDENALCGGDCCALEDAPNGGCKWKTGGSGYCCVLNENGNPWNLQHIGDNSCPVSQYQLPAGLRPSPAESSVPPSDAPHMSGWELCCDDKANDCPVCERFDSRSCKQLFDENAHCGGDCCAFEDTPDGGCKWSTGGNGSCCVQFADGGSLSWLEHQGEKSCPVSQYDPATGSRTVGSSPTMVPTSFPPVSATSNPLPSPTKAPTAQTTTAQVTAVLSTYPSTVPGQWVSGLSTCCDEESDDCPACEWIEARSCQQLFDDDAVCGGDCCAFEDTPNGGCKWSTGGNGLCCVKSESGNPWNLQHMGSNTCPESKYPSLTDAQSSVESPSTNTTSAIPTQSPDSSVESPSTNTTSAMPTQSPQSSVESPSTNTTTAMPTQSSVGSPSTNTTTAMPTQSPQSSVESPSTNTTTAMPTQSPVSQAPTAPLDPLRPRRQTTNATFEIQKDSGELLNESEIKAFEKATTRFLDKKIENTTIVCRVRGQSLNGSLRKGEKKWMYNLTIDTLLIAPKFAGSAKDFGIVVAATMNSTNSVEFLEFVQAHSPGTSPELEALEALTSVVLATPTTKGDDLPPMFLPIRAQPETLSPVLAPPSATTPSDRAPVAAASTTESNGLFSLPLQIIRWVRELFQSIVDWFTLLLLGRKEK